MPTETLGRVRHICNNLYISLVVCQPKIGQVKLMRWSEFHFLESPTRYMEIIRVEVIKPAGRHRKFKPLWLA
ncbi:hypothetical protein [Nostoc sp.]|uniref:hypothetical protein n=1 Tax=Nostoc sp. TaxID=1180 RepID=UPI002FF482C3